MHAEESSISLEMTYSRVFIQIGHDIPLEGIINVQRHRIQKCTSQIVDTDQQDKNAMFIWNSEEENVWSFGLREANHLRV